MTKRWLMAGVVLASGLAFDLPTADAQEVEVEGPLAGAPAVRHMRVYRQGRLQLMPFAGFTLQDEFSRTMVFGAQAHFHFTDWLGVGVWGGFGGVHLDTDLTKQVKSRGITTDRNALSLPSRRFFGSQIAEITWMAAGQLVFVPLRGKVSLFQKVFVDTDLTISAGAAAIGLEERADTPDGACASTPAPNADAGDPCVQTTLARSSRVAIAPTFGVMLTFYANDFLGITVGWRGLPFAWNTSGTDERGEGPGGNFPDGRITSKDRIFHFNQMVSVGLAIYLPTKAKISD